MSDTQTQTAPARIDHAPGTFCWWEITTTDLEGALAFYSGLFGWEMNIGSDLSAPDAYPMAYLDGRPILGLHRLGGPTEGMPPHWNTYLATDDADATVKEAQALGAKVVVEPFDVETHGRMAVIQDPEGTFISFWQAKDHPGIQVLGEPGGISWTELCSRDAEAAGAFYGQLFGYEVRKMDMPTGPYRLLHSQGKDRGGILQMTDEWAGIPTHFMNYVHVVDVDASVAKAEALGGTVKVPAFDVPGVGRMAVLADPQGAVFSVHAE